MFVGTAAAIAAALAMTGLAPGSAVLLSVAAVTLAHQGRAVGATRRNYRALANQVPAGVVRCDVHGTVTFVNDEALRVHGLDLDADPASLTHDLVHPADRDRLAWMLATCLSDGSPFEDQWRVVHPDGTVRWVHGRGAAERGTDGSVLGCVSTLLDAHDRQVAAAAERTANEQFRAAFDNAPIGFAVIGCDGRVQRANAALCELTGYTAQELCNHPPFAMVHVDDLADVRERFEALGADADQLSLQCRILDSAGRELWIEVRITVVRDGDGEPDHALAQILDVTERRHYEHQLRHLAEHDPLTGLLNRRGLEHRLAAQLAHGRRYGSKGALLMLDLDGFKLANDTLGHATGDDLIVSVAEALAARLRETDVLARLGGDEFAVILPSETGEDVDAMAQALLEVVRACGDAFQARLPARVTASIGVAEFEADVTAQEMLIRGDVAMYDAKEAGRDCFARHVDDGGQHGAVPRVQAQMRWLDRIVRAFEEDRFVLYAQPILDLQHDRPALHEVLVRMVDEHGEIVPPATFLYIIERYGLAPRLDAWVIEQAIDAMAAARLGGGRLRLSVNVSGASVGDASIIDLVRRRLRATQLDPADLMLELTETAAIADLSGARQFADEMHALGVRLALDDFGAGFGSFAYVKHLPFDVFKLDGQFVKNAVHDDVDRQIIASVTGLARGLGKQTVAEWVPDDATVRMLLREGVDYGQGYHLGEPAPLEQLLPAPQAPAVVRRSAAAR